MIIDPTDEGHIYAEEGKGIYHIATGNGPFSEVILGYGIYDGVIRKETIDDYEERDLPEPEEPDVPENIIPEE